MKRGLEFALSGALLFGACSDDGKDTDSKNPNQVYCDFLNEGRAGIADNSGLAILRDWCKGNVSGLLGDRVGLEVECDRGGFTVEWGGCSNILSGRDNNGTDEINNFVAGCGPDVLFTFVAVSVDGQVKSCFNWLSCMGGEVVDRDDICPEDLEPDLEIGVPKPPDCDFDPADSSNLCSGLEMMSSETLDQVVETLFEDYKYELNRGETPVVRFNCKNDDKETLILGPGLTDEEIRSAIRARLEQFFANECVGFGKDVCSSWITVCTDSSLGSCNDGVFCAPN